MHLFRVDHREFKVGEKITSTSSYQKAIDIEHQITELCLEKTRPNNLISRNNLFLFCNLKDAFQFTIDISNINIYYVDILQSEIFFKGDMNYIDTIFDAVKKEQTLKDIYKLCCNYWNQIRTSNPCYETLVQEALVMKKICASEDIQKFNEEFKIHQQIEKCPLYIKKSNQIIL